MMLSLAFAQDPGSLELPAVSGAAAVAEGPGVVLHGGVSSVVLPPTGEVGGVPVVPRLGGGYLAGPVDDALLIGGQLDLAGTLTGDEALALVGQGTLTAAVGTPDRTAWVGADVGVGVRSIGAEVAPQLLGSGTLAVDLDDLTSITVRLGGAADASGLTPRLGVSFVYRPGVRSTLALGAQAGRRPAEAVVDRYPVTAHVLAGARIGPDLVEPEVYVAPVRVRPEDVVDVVEHPAIRCLPGDVATGLPPPQGYEAWCVRVTRTGEVSRNGMYLKWHPNGIVSTIGEYTLDRRSGRWEWLDTDGSPKEQGAYAKDVEVGTWVRYYTDGGVEEEAEMDAGRLHGAYRLFHRSGLVKVEGTHEQGQRVGTWIDYDEAGVPERERIYLDGHLQKQRSLPEDDLEDPLELPQDAP